MRNNCIFVTYDVNLKRYLLYKGIDNILHGLNPNTYNRFWVYERNDNLFQALKEWFNK